MTNKTYDIFLDNQKIGTTKFEKADASMGVVFGEIIFSNIDSGYEYVKTHCLINNIEFMDQMEIRMISATNIPNMKVLDCNGNEIKGEGYNITGMDSDIFEIEIFDIPYPFYEEEFPHHVKYYREMMEDEGIINKQIELNNFSPYVEFTLTTDLSPEEVKERFKVNIEPLRDSRVAALKTPKKIYEGQLDGNQFVINRILIATRHKILIQGRILALKEQTLINIKMEYEPLVKSMNRYSIFVISGMCLLFLTLGIKAGSVLMSFAGFGFFLLMYFFKKLSFSFKDECNDAQRFLAILFEGKRIN